MKILLLVVDGLPDVRAEGKPTPLEAAHTPTWDALTSEGVLSLTIPYKRGVPVGSDVGHLLIFSYSYPQDYPNRGPLEALGAGLSLNKGDIAFRVNLAIVKEGVVVDRRAGRLPTEEAKRLEGKLNAEFEDFMFEFKPTTEHRGVLVVRGTNGELVEDNDPHREGLPYRFPKVKVNPKLEDALRRYLEWANQEVQRYTRANAILLRGSGTVKSVRPFVEKVGMNAYAVAGGALYKGVARYVGMEVLDVPGATGDKNTNLKAKAEAVNRINEGFVFVHIKATDSFGHDGDWEGKKEFIERIDSEFLSNLNVDSLDLLVTTSDHSTPVSYRGHSGHEVVTLFHGHGVRSDSTKAFNEYEAQKGGLHVIYSSDIVPMIKGFLGLNEKVGE